MYRNKHPFLLICMCLLIGSQIAGGQDSIKLETIKPFSYSFNIEDNTLIGDGAELLREAISNAHMVMLGDRYRSLQEEQFASILAEELNQLDYNTMVIETGTASADLAMNLIRDNSNAIDKFKQLNQEYALQRGQKLYAPIHYFKNTEGAQRISFLNKENWRIVGVGVDSWNSIPMLVDELYHNLTKENQEELKTSYHKVTKLLDSLYQHVSTDPANEDVLNVTNGIIESSDFSAYLDKVSHCKMNHEIIESMRFSIDYWRMFGNKEFFQKNKNNSANNKIQIRHQLDKIGFDFESDKLFVSMYKGHLAKGTTSNGFYGVGNTLTELFGYHGRESVSIALFRRYYKEDGATLDTADEKLRETQRLFIELGKEDEWTLVDLREFNKAFYWGNYHLHFEFIRLFNSYDFIFIYYP